MLSCHLSQRKNLQISYQFEFKWQMRTTPLKLSWADVKYSLNILVLQESEMFPNGSWAALKLIILLKSDVFNVRSVIKCLPTLLVINNLPYGIMQNPCGIG